jgi:hypothetical protein
MGPAFVVSSIGETGPRGPRLTAEVAGLAVLDVAHPAVQRPSSSRARRPLAATGIDGGIARARAGSGANALGSRVSS